MKKMRRTSKKGFYLSRAKCSKFASCCVPVQGCHLAFFSNCLPEIKLILHFEKNSIFCGLFVNFKANHTMPCAILKFVWVILKNLYDNLAFLPSWELDLYWIYLWPNLAIFIFWGLATLFLDPLSKVTTFVYIQFFRRISYQ